MTSVHTLTEDALLLTENHVGEKVSLGLYLTERHLYKNYSLDKTDA